MNVFKDRAKRSLGGFTLVELLIVIVIIGVMAVVIGPTFTTGSDIARMRTASRGVMQMSRYARTMALLHQTPVELVFTSDGGLSVAQAGGGGDSLVSERAFSVTNAAESVAAKGVSVAAEPADEGPEGAAEQGGASYVMADLAVEKKYDQVTFTFEGFTDTMDDGRSSQQSLSLRDKEESEPEGDVQSFRVRYKSNGTCRPYRVRVAADGDEAYAVTVAVDVLGTAKIEDEDE